MNNLNELVHTAPSITVDGKEYQVKRLGLKHIFAFIKILQQARIVNQFADMMADLRPKEGEEDTDERKGRAVGVAMNLIFSLVEAETDIYGFIALITGMTKEQAEDLPLEALVDLVMAIVDAPDIGAFTKAVQAAIQKRAPKVTVPAEV